jgi:glycosyltransferase involved in cell wall biosynthesis
MNNEKIAILIPCYNESLTIKKVINDFQRELPEADIYVYDNNSTDNTYEIARNEGALVKKRAETRKRKCHSANVF